MNFSQPGAWCWFGDPRAVRVGDATYIGYVSPDGSVMIAKYDHLTQATTTKNLRAQAQVDDHINPAIVYRTSNRLFVDYAIKRGLPDSAMFQRATVGMDFTNWTAGQTISDAIGNLAGGMGYAYPNPVQLAAEGPGVMYLFFRGGNWNPCYTKTMDGATTWSATKSFISNPGQRPYVKVASDEQNRIHFAYTDGHPAEAAWNSLYYAYYENGNFYKADGTLIRSLVNAPFPVADGDKVMDAQLNGVNYWIQDLAFDAQQNPVMVFNTLFSYGALRDHHYWYASREAGAWKLRYMTDRGGPMVRPALSGQANGYSGGACLDHCDPTVVYLSRDVQANGMFEIEKWVTADGGDTWTTTAITSNSTQPNFRPVVPHNRVSGSLDLLWMRGTYVEPKNYQTCVTG